MYACEWEASWANTNKYFGHYTDCGIFVVDLANGRWEEMEKPIYGEGNFHFTMYLGVLRYGLSMISLPLMTHADMWVMKEYGVKESWKMFIIKYSHDFMGYDFLYLPFCMSIEGEILFKIGSVLLTYSQINDSMRFPKFQNYGHLGETKN